MCSQTCCSPAPLPPPPCPLLPFPPSPLSSRTGPCATWASRLPPPPPQVRPQRPRRCSHWQPRWALMPSSATPRCTRHLQRPTWRGRRRRRRCRHLRRRRWQPPPARRRPRPCPPQCRGWTPVPSFDRVCYRRRRSLCAPYRRGPAAGGTRDVAVSHCSCFVLLSLSELGTCSSDSSREAACRACCVCRGGGARRWARRGGCGGGSSGRWLGQSTVGGGGRRAPPQPYPCPERAGACQSWTHQLAAAPVSGRSGGRADRV